MDISILKLAQNLENYDFGKKKIWFQYREAQEQQVIYGEVTNIGNKPFPVYFTDEDKWVSFDEEDSDDWGDFELQFNIKPQGIMDIWIDDDPEQLCYYIFHNPTELNDFLKILPQANNNALNKEIAFKEYKFSDIIDEIYISISIDNVIKFLPLNLIKNELEQITFNRLIRTIFLGDSDFLLEIGNWNFFCAEYLKNIVEDSVSIEQVPILINTAVYSNSSPYIDPLFPYLGISVKESFSAQYLFDFLNDSQDGDLFLQNLGESIIKRPTLKTLTISAPGSFLQQIKYSTEFRLQFQEYKWEVASTKNHFNESIIDIKLLYKNRRENVREFILNQNRSTFLDILRNPLPYNLEKSYRAYVRAANELDRLTYAGKLYNLILRSIVFYPLEEMIYLGIDKHHNEIVEMMRDIQGAKLLSDGTYLKYFNTIAKIIGKNNDLKIFYFSPLIKAVQAEYNNFQEIIPKRNNWAHYREHSAEFLKTLDEFIPRILNILRNALNGISFFLIENQNYKKDGLYITAKKIMGYEVDIETIEFKTSLPGKYFIKDSLIAYKDNANYTVSLENFFSVRIVQSEVIQMGIYKGGAAGEGDFEY